MRKLKITAMVLTVVALTTMVFAGITLAQRPSDELEGVLGVRNAALGQGLESRVIENRSPAAFGSEDGISAAAPAEELSDADIEGILFMREEEKLARDVYLTMYEMWGASVFQNIANSEAAHMAAVKTLIDRYGLVDPAAGTEIGVFEDEALQALYDQLVAQGSQSIADALRVGAVIEEIDILDLQKHIAETDKDDIEQVYQNLMRGSRNHLRAFVSNLERQTGETYEPQYLDQAVYEAIVTSQAERGGSRRDAGKGGSRGGRGASSRQPNGTQGRREQSNSARSG
jgi:hypothetical protein